MKTETQIAKENVERTHINICNEHKQACQRWLEFLKKFKGLYAVDYEVRELVQEKLKDLKQAIKIYDENEI